MAAQANAAKHAFLNMPAPVNYVAGLGRGASGFTTRSDIGPARAGPSEETVAAARAKRGEVDEEPGGGEEADPDQFQDPENETGLFAGTTYEKDDEEADKIWEQVDDQMDSRRRKKREEREKLELQKLRSERPKIQSQFADLKRGLSSISEDEWGNIPEAGNLTGKRRKAAAARGSRDGKSYAVPDSVLLGAKEKNMSESSLSQDQMLNDGTQTSLGGMGGSGTTTSLTEIGEARNKIFSHKLDQASSGTASTSGTSSSIDPKGYLTDLSSVVIKSDTEIGDLKKARGLLDSVIKTNPKHAPGWIAAARLEEHAGKMAAARKIISQGFEHCPKSEDVWLEGARLNTTDNAKVIIARAAQHLSTSVKIWLKATELESDPNSKKRVLQKSLEYIPHSTKLWKELVSLEDSPENARALLAGAVEAIPSSVELWLALARLSEVKEAKQVLNNARKTVPTSHEIWIAAIRVLEEENEVPEKTQDNLDKLMVTAVGALKKAGAVLGRERWLQLAEEAERQGSPGTCAAIVKATVGLEVEEEDRRNVWVEDAETALREGFVETARSILAYTLRFFPDRASIWRVASELETEHGSRESLESLLEKAVTNCPKAEILWLMYAKEKWQGDGDIPAAREILSRAFDHNMGSEEISLAAAKLESENGEKDAARKLLEISRQEVNSARVWIKSAVFERNQGDWNKALELVESALEKFVKEEKLYLMKAQLVEKLKSTENGENVKSARETLGKGFKNCPTSIPIWINGSRLEERAGLTIRARALLEKARLLNPKNEVLWFESSKVEERSGSIHQSKSMVSRGLQECPSSGLLWNLSIWLEPKPSRKTKSADALKKTGDDARIINSVARLFWNDRKLDQSRKWFERSVKSDSVWGDGWAWWLKFEETHGNKKSLEEVVRRCKLANPRYGEVWQEVRKDPGHFEWDLERVLRETAKRLQIVN